MALFGFETLTSLGGTNFGAVSAVSTREALRILVSNGMPLSGTRIARLDDILSDQYGRLAFIGSVFDPPAKDTASAHEHADLLMSEGKQEPPPSGGRIFSVMFDEDGASVPGLLLAEDKEDALDLLEQCRGWGGEMGILDCAAEELVASRGAFVTFATEPLL